MSERAYEPRHRGEPKTELVHRPKADGTCSLLCNCPTPLTDDEIDFLDKSRAVLMSERARAALRALVAEWRADATSWGTCRHEWFSFDKIAELLDDDALWDEAHHCADQTCLGECEADYGTDAPAALAAPADSGGTE